MLERPQGGETGYKRPVDQVDAQSGLFIRVWETRQSDTDFYRVTKYRVQWLTGCEAVHRFDDLNRVVSIKVELEAQQVRAVVATPC